MGYIQGNNAVLMLFKSDYEPFVCATEFSLEIAAEPLPIRTVGDGHYNKNTYNTLGFTLTLSGLLAFDDNAFTGWDMIDKQLGFVDCLFRLSYEDDQANAKSFQGSCVIQTSTLASRVDEFTTNEFSLLGNGKLDFFDGLVPCDSEITDILFTDLDNNDNQIAIAYQFTGTPVRVNWYLDEYTDTPRTGFVEAADTIYIHDIDTGAHSIRLEPICGSGFAGVDLTKDFIVTAGETCNVTIATRSTSITDQSITWAFTTTGGDPLTNYVVITKNGVEIYRGSYSSPITVHAVPFGPADYTYDFYCGNNLLGDTFSETITIDGGATLITHYDIDVPDGVNTIMLTVKKGPFTLLFWAAPNERTDVLVVSDVIQATVTTPVARRLIVSDSTPTILYDVFGTTLTFTIPTITSGKQYFITLSRS